MPRLLGRVLIVDDDPANREFDGAPLDGIAGRLDPLGTLARVFVGMAREVRARESRLAAQVAELRIEIDEARKVRAVAEMNLATALALQGRRVAVVDTDIQSPGIHILFGLAEDRMSPALNDLLWGRCAIEAAAHDVSADVVRDAGGCVLLVPSSINASEIARVLREGYDVATLNEGFQGLIDRRRLDHLLIDTHPGLTTRRCFRSPCPTCCFSCCGPTGRTSRGPR